MEPETINIVKLEGVPDGLKLYEVIEELDFHSLIGLHYVCDYSIPKYDNSIFLYLNDDNEYKRIKEQKFIMLKGQKVTIVIHHWFIMGVDRIGNIYETGPKSFYGSPANIMIKPLPVKKREITPMIYRLVKYFEQKHANKVIGVLMFYDSKKKKFRNYAFIGFNSWNLMLSYDNHTFIFDNVEIKAHASIQTTVVSSLINVDIVQGKADATVEKINWLNVDLSDRELDDASAAAIQSVRGKKIDWLNVESESKLSIGKRPGTSGINTGSQSKKSKSNENEDIALQLLASEDDLRFDSD